MVWYSLLLKNFLALFKGKEMGGGEFLSLLAYLASTHRREIFSRISQTNILFVVIFIPGSHEQMSTPRL